MFFTLNILAFPQSLGFYNVAIVKEKQRPCLESIPNNEMKAIIKKSWHHEPNKRPTAKGEYGYNV